MVVGMHENGPYYRKGWFSQIGQDRCVAALFQDRRGGYYIDLAANDAISLSNTYHLDRNLSWRGLCIEPNAAYLEGLLTKRTCNLVHAVVAGEAGMARFRFAGESGAVLPTAAAEAQVMDAIKQRFAVNNNHALKMRLFNQFKDVRTVSIASVLREARVPRHVDYFSLECVTAVVELVYYSCASQHVPYGVCLRHTCIRGLCSRSLSPSSLPRGLTASKAPSFPSCAPSPFMSTL